MFSRIAACIIAQAVAIIYILMINILFNVQLSHGFSIGLVFIYMPAIVFTLVGIICLISPDWLKAEF